MALVSSFTLSPLQEATGLANLIYKYNLKKTHTHTHCCANTGKMLMAFNVLKFNFFPLIFVMLYVNIVYMRLQINRRGEKKNVQNSMSMWFTTIPFKYYNVFYRIKRRYRALFPSLFVSIHTFFCCSIGNFHNRIRQQ